MNDINYIGSYSSFLLAGLPIFCRVLPAVIYVPFLGGEHVPAYIKIGFALILSVFIFIASPNTFLLDNSDILLLTGLSIKELFIGFTIGYLVMLFFRAFMMAGILTDHVRGYTTAEIHLPHLKEKTSPLGQLYFLLSIVIFLSLNGHHLYINSFIQSFQSIPVTFIPTAESLNLSLIIVYKQSASIFLTALSLTVPVIIVIILVDLALGFIGRSAPQINLFFLGLPLKSIVGILIVFLSLLFVTNIMADWLNVPEYLIMQWVNSFI